ncbi:MAG: hypothetical protein ACOCYX_01940 [Spirochaetota bacterium]
MNLEVSNGTRHENPSPAVITATLEQIGTTLDHCILELDGDEFVQAAGAPGRLFVQYGASGSLLNSERADLDVATVARVFTDAMAGNDAWKSELGFRPAGGAAGAPAGTSGGAATAGTAGPATGAGSSLKNEIFGQVRRQAGREVSYGVGRMARRLLRRLLGGRF